jgi:hypothetical protein
VFIQFRRSVSDKTASGENGQNDGGIVSGGIGAFAKAGDRASEAGQKISARGSARFAG